MSVRLQENDMKSLKIYFKVSQRERGRGGRGRVKCRCVVTILRVHVKLKLASKIKEKIVLISGTIYQFKNFTISENIMPKY